MSILKTVQKGPIKKPFFVLLYGTPGVGKSTFASQFPSPLFLALEDGTNQLDVARLFPKTFSEILQALSELNEGKHEYKSLVIDSVDHLEILIWDEVCRENKGVKNIADIPYGGGYVQALSKWKELGEQLKLLRNKMNVVLIAHSIVKQINDPSLPMPYDKHVIKLHQKAADYLKESVEAVLFANYEVFVSKKDSDRTARAFGGERRLLHTMASPSFEGKNRYSLPASLEFDYDEFVKAVEQADPNDLSKIRERIEHYLPQLKDEKKREAATAHYEKNKSNLPELIRSEQRLKTIIETT